MNNLKKKEKNNQQLFSLIFRTKRANRKWKGRFCWTKIDLWKNI